MATKFVESDDLEEKKDKEIPFNEEELYEPMDLSLSVRRVPITLHKPDDNVPWECEGREMDGINRDAFLTRQKNRKADRNGQPTEFKDIMTDLIGRCLYDKTLDKLVPLEDIRHFPATVQFKLYKRFIKLNGLDDAAVDEAKND